MSPANPSSSFATSRVSARLQQCCRHRAGPIALGSGCKTSSAGNITGWTTRWIGRLIGTPDVEGVEFFDRSTMGMVPLRCETWEQFIFVNFDLES